MAVRRLVAESCTIAHSARRQAPSARRQAPPEGGVRGCAPASFWSSYAMCSTVQCGVEREVPGLRARAAAVYVMLWLG